MEGPVDLKDQYKSAQTVLFLTFFFDIPGFRNMLSDVERGRLMRQEKLRMSSSLHAAASRRSS